MEQSQAAATNQILADGLERRIGSMAQDVEKLTECLKANKSASVRVESNHMIVEVTGPLSFFDPDSYRSIRSNSRSFFWSCLPEENEDALLFFDALFLEETIKVNMGAKYLVAPGLGVSGKERHVMPTAVPNPHIHYSQCLGQYRGDMQEALAKSDFVGVISLCVASGLSLHISEALACGRFIEDVTGGSHKAVLLPNGEAVSYKQAVAWLKDTRQKLIQEVGKTDGETNPTAE